MALRIRNTVLDTPSIVTASLNHEFKGRYDSEFRDMGPYYTTGMTSSSNRETYDETHPGFRKRWAAGEIINSPYSSTVTTSVPPNPSTVNLKLNIREPDDTVWGTNLSGSYFIFALSGAPALLEMTAEQRDERDSKINLAITKAFASIGESEMLVGATLGEARETVNFFVDTAERVVRIYKDVKKLRLKLALKKIRFKDYQQRYMEYRYALRPVVGDMVSFLKAYTAETGIIRKVYRSTISGSAEHTDELIGLSILNGVAVDVHRKYSMNYSARVGVLCEIRKSRFDAFGVSKFPETVYELLPLSFIADWFANIGDTIAAHTPNVGVTQLASWVTVRSKSVAVNSTANVRFPPGSYTQYNEKSCSVGATEWSHTVESTVRETSPPLRTLPQMDINLNVLKVVDLCAILRQLAR